ECRRQEEKPEHRPEERPEEPVEPVGEEPEQHHHDPRCDQREENQEKKRHGSIPERPSSKILMKAVLRFRGPVRSLPENQPECSPPARPCETASAPSSNWELRPQGLPPSGQRARRYTALPRPARCVPGLTNP